MRDHTDLILFPHKEKNKGHEILIFLRSASIITVLLPVIVGILCAFNWDAAFTLFHEIMFRNDYWIFDEATDPVIMILPDAFFFHCAVMIILLILIGSLLCMGFRSFFRTQVYAIMDRY